MKRIILTTSLAMHCAFCTLAQPNHNVLQVTNATYTELSGDTKMPLEFGGGDPFEIKELLGETFTVYGKAWLMDTINKGVLVFPNGFIEIVEPNNFVICDALLRYMDSIDVNSKISYKVEGSSGNKIVKVQWKNLKIRTGPAGNFVNLQIWLYQKDGMVEYRYGPSSSNNASGYTQATGPSVGISYSDFNFNSFVEKIWIYGTPPNIIIDSARNVNFPNIWGVPANGTVYRFIPKQSVSVENHGARNDVRLFPNPVNNELVITSDKLAGLTEVVIADMLGRKVWEYQLTPQNKQLKINTAQLAPGNYNISVTAEKLHFNSLVAVSH